MEGFSGRVKSRSEKLSQVSAGVMEPKVITREYIRDFFKFRDTERERKILNYIKRHLVLRQYQHNAYICRAGDASTAMYFIEDGVLNVRGPRNEIINELQPGRYFGEIAAITGDKRGADVQAWGDVLVYELDKRILHALLKNNPGIFGIFLKNVYDQGTDRYRKLIRALNSRRGLGVSGSRIKATPLSLFINYYIVFFLFFNILLFSPGMTPGQVHPVWLCLPIAFLVGYIIITGRALESLVLAVMLITILLSKLNFLSGFYTHILNTVVETPDIILLVVLMGSLTRLFSASGSINALKKVAEQNIKSGKGTLLASFFSTVLVAIDEYLCILINGACFVPLSDQKRIAREKSAMVMGMSPMALCIINPISLTGIYLSGVIFLASGDKLLFLSAVRYNFSSLFTIAFILLLSLGLIPLAGPLKTAVKRVKEGGALWPPGTDVVEDQEGANRGRVANLVLPVLVLIVSSVAAGSLEAGGFSVNVLYGMIITLIFTFFLYCFQQYMTPEQFFRNIVFGIESMLAPIVMFVMGKCFAAGVDEIGFSAWLNSMVKNIIGGQVWTLPAIIFGICTLVGALIDNPWAMYAIGIPLAVELAEGIGGNASLYVGAVCAAGLIGNEIALGDIFFTGPMLGINPMAYYRSKFPYVILITILSLAGYAA
ncbi:MAG: cyclic nucleotide-binding domain-containing protein, partial [Spirochaetaceae bacterium]|nr:cyclic nucleotide-binding domain-containing protein [Spirochaetaceae bacterium]